MNLSQPSHNNSKWEKTLSIIEVFFPLFCAVILHTFIYTAIGNNFTHKTDYGYFIDSPFDKDIPFISIFILPYLLTNIYGLFIII